MFDGDTKPSEVANVMNEFFTNITHTMCERFSEATLDLDNDEFIYLGYDDYKNHPSVNSIVEKCSVLSNFELKELVLIIFSHPTTS